MKQYDKTTSNQKTSSQTLACPTASFLATGGCKFELFKNTCMVYKHAVVAAFRIYAQRGEVAAKREGWSLFIKYHPEECDYQPRHSRGP